MTAELATSERETLDHVMMFGSDSYPIHKLRSRWLVDRFFGNEVTVRTFKTKAEAIEAVEQYLEGLRNKKAGRN